MTQGYPLTNYERGMLKQRKLNPDDYVVLKRLNYTIVLRNLRTGMIKYLDKRS